MDFVRAPSPSLNLLGIFQHMVQRGSNRQANFFVEQDYRVYLDKLKEYSKKYQVEVHAFVLMTHHVHLLLTPLTKRGVSQLIQSFGASLCKAYEPYILANGFIVGRATQVYISR